MGTKQKMRRHALPSNGPTEGLGGLAPDFLSSEFPFASVSKRVFVHNLSYETDEPVGGTHFHENCSFNAEAQSNSEMVYKMQCVCFSKLYDRYEYWYEYNSGIRFFLCPLISMDFCFLELPPIRPPPDYRVIFLWTDKCI